MKKYVPLMLSALLVSCVHIKSPNENVHNYSALFSYGYNDLKIRGELIKIYEAGNYDKTFAQFLESVDLADGIEDKFISKDGLKKFIKIKIRT